MNPANSFAEALAAGGIFQGIGVTDRDSALRAIAQNMTLPDHVDRQLLLNMLIEREAVQSTGIGDGIATPHVRNPVSLRVSQAVVNLCLLPTPIEFGAVDGQPVQALFTLICPTAQTHLRLLSQLANAWRDPGFKSAITPLATAEEILKEARRVEG